MGESGRAVVAHQLSQEGRAMPHPNDRSLAAPKCQSFAHAATVIVAIAAPLMCPLTATAHIIEIAETGSFNTMGGRLHHAVTDGRWIAWSEHYGQQSMANLYARNIDTGQLRVVTASSPDLPGIRQGTANIWTWAWWHPQIGISDAMLVYTDRRNYPTGQNHQVRVHNLDTGADAAISPSWVNDPLLPAIDGRRVVYQHAGNWAVMGDWATHQTYWLASADYPTPDVSGDVVVWKTGNAGSDILYRNVVTGEQGVAFRAGAFEEPRNPVIDGHIVAWSMRDQSDGNGNIVRVMAYDLRTGQLTTIREHTGSGDHRSMVAVSGDIVVWEDWRDGSSDIYGYDLSTGQEFPIATGWTHQHAPSIAGDLVVWSDSSWLFGDSIGWARLVRTPEPGALTILLTAAAFSFRRFRRA
jgi:beta propeller repeat protein